jgi:FAD/FMN-containing dehydrogenase
MSANTSAAVSGSGSGTEGVISSWAFATTTQEVLITVQVMDYTATDKHKTALVRSNNAAFGVEAHAVRYASTSAVTSLLVFPSSGNWAAGGTFSLYGVVA